MLRTTPESQQEQQPLTCPDKNLVIVWDGRLDNREELRHELSAVGAVLRDTTDAELALQAYACWGEDSPKRMLGDFAFAVWDEKRKQLFCARDHMGARPFHYTHNDRFFAFASEDEALTNLPGLTKKPNVERIAYHLVPTFLGFDYLKSWFEDVRLLGAAQAMTVTEHGIRKGSTFWKLELGEESSYASDEACQKAFLDVFGEAVRCRMRCTGDIAAMMSGGMDSAAISAMAKRILSELPGTSFHTYSAIADQPEECVESRCILGLTENLGECAHYLGVPSFTGMLDVQDLIDTAWSNAHPVDNSIMLPSMMCRAAGRSGHRVLLTGVSGDLVAYVPPGYIARLLRHGSWRRAWRECKAASRNNTYLRGTRPLKLLWQNAKGAYIPRGIRQFVQKLRGSTATPPLQGTLVNRDFAKRIRLEARMLEGRSQAGLSLMELQEMHLKVLSPPHGITCGLSAYDRVAGQHGVELRDPWADRRVIEFFVRLPQKYRICDGWTKHIVRTAFGLALPSQVAWRVGKEHLGWHFFRRLMDESRKRVHDTLEHGLGGIEEFLNMSGLLISLTRENGDGKHDYGIRGLFGQEALSGTSVGRLWRTA